MKLSLMPFACISLLAGITFFTVTGDAALLFVPAAVNFAVLGMLTILYRLFVGKDEKNEQGKEPNKKENYSAYRNVHSL